MSNANKLLKDIDNKISSWNERSMFKIKGVGNLSMSDLDTLRLYADTYIRTGSFSGLMPPRGCIEKILSLYGIEDKSMDMFNW